MRARTPPAVGSAAVRSLSRRVGGATRRPVCCSSGCHSPGSFITLHRGVAQGAGCAVPVVVRPHGRRSPCRAGRRRPLARPGARPRRHRDRRASSDIRALNGMAVARDGTGAVVYTKNVGAVAHVFVSRLAAGAFQPPVQVDAGLAGPSSQPVVAASQNGLVLVAFINGGTLYVAQAASRLSPLSAPGALFTGAANPSLSITNFGKAYLAFTAVAGAGGGDVRAAYYFQGAWALEASPLDASAGDAAGVGSGRPDVAASGDGIGIVAWGEAGHIYTRRVIAATPSTVVEQADPASLAGWSERSSSLPSIASGGDSTYAVGGLPGIAGQRLGDAVAGADEPPAWRRLRRGLRRRRSHHRRPEGADQPQAAVTEYGTRLRHLGDRPEPHALHRHARWLREPRADRARRLPAQQRCADAVPASAGLVSNLIAWQQTPGVAGTAEIRVRYALDGADLGTEQVVSDPALGATDAGQGLAAAGDVAGDAAAAWVQGSGASTVDRRRPALPGPRGLRALLRLPLRHTASPLLMWSPAAELWGAPTYACASTAPRWARPTATSLRSPCAAGRRAPLLPDQRRQPGGRDHQLPGGHGVRGHRAAARDVEAEWDVDRQHPRAAAGQLHRPAAGRAAHVGRLGRVHRVRELGRPLAARADPPHDGRPRLHPHPRPTRSRSPSPTGRATGP